MDKHVTTKTRKGTETRKPKPAKIAVVETEKKDEVKTEKMAVIAASGRQFIVKPGQIITMDKQEGKEKETITFDKVLLIAEGEGENILIGKPFIEGAKVTANIIVQEKGDKIRVAKFKAKSRYRKVMGFRPRLTKVKINEISSCIGK